MREGGTVIGDVAQAVEGEVAVLAFTPEAAEGTGAASEAPAAAEAAEAVTEAPAAEATPEAPAAEATPEANPAVSRPWCSRAGPGRTANRWRPTPDHRRW